MVSQKLLVAIWWKDDIQNKLFHFNHIFPACNFIIFKMLVSLYLRARYCWAQAQRFQGFVVMLPFHDKYYLWTLTKQCKTAISWLPGEPISLHNCICGNWQDINTFFSQIRWNVFELMQLDQAMLLEDENVMGPCAAPGSAPPHCFPKNFTRLDPFPMGNPVPHGLPAPWRALASTLLATVSCCILGMWHEWSTRPIQK